MDRFIVAGMTIIILAVGLLFIVISERKVHTIDKGLPPVVQKW